MDDVMEKDNMNYRERRLNACRAADTLRDVIEKLGLEDGSQPPRPDCDYNPVPAKVVQNELNNMTTSLLRLILAFNDGQLSESKLQTF